MRNRANLTLELINDYICQSNKTIFNRETVFRLKGTLLSAAFSHRARSTLLIIMQNMDA